MPFEWKELLQGLDELLPTQIVHQEIVKNTSILQIKNKLPMLLAFEKNAKIISFMTYPVEYPQLILEWFSI